MTRRFLTAAFCCGVLCALASVSGVEAQTSGVGGVAGAAVSGVGAAVGGVGAAVGGVGAAVGGVGAAVGGVGAGAAAASVQRSAESGLLSAALVQPWAASVLLLAAAAAAAQLAAARQAAQQAALEAVQPAAPRAATALAAVPVVPRPAMEAPGVRPVAAPPRGKQAVLHQARVLPVLERAAQPQPTRESMISARSPPGLPPQPPRRRPTQMAVPKLQAWLGLSSQGRAQARQAQARPDRRRAPIPWRQSTSAPRSSRPSPTA